MSYTTIATKLVGDPIDVTDWSLIRDNFEDHEARINNNSFKGVRATRTTTQSIPDSAFTAIVWNGAETYDEGGWHSASDDEVIVPAGVIPSGFTTIAVSVFCQIYWAANGTGARAIRIMKNGVEIGATTSPVAHTGDMGVQCVSETFAAAGDTFSVEVNQDSGGALNIDGAAHTCAFAVSRRGPF